MIYFRPPGETVQRIAQQVADATDVSCGANYGPETRAGVPGVFHRSWTRGPARDDTEAARRQSKTYHKPLQ